MYHTQHEVILDHMTLSGNESQGAYPLLKKACELSWYKLYKSTKESIARKWYPVENSNVKFPKSLEVLSGIYIVDHCGDLKALFEDNVKNVIVKPAKKCGCTACDTEECLCPTVQDAIIQNDVVINSVTHTNKTVTRILKNGQVVEESFTWVASFNPNGSFKEAIEVHTQITKCNLETLPCGCPANTEENVTLLLNCGCITECYAPFYRSRYPALWNPFGYYKLAEDGRSAQLFNSDGRRSYLTQVLLVFKSNGADALVNDYTRPALIALLDFTSKQYNPLYDKFDRIEAKRNWNEEQFDMLKYLNPIPYEWFSQVDDATRKAKNMPYYGRVHSDFVSHETTATICCPTVVPQNVTNIISSNTANGRGLLKLVVDAGAGNPVSDLATFQHNSLIDWGSLSQDKVEFTIEKWQMKNWGLNPDFTFDKNIGELTFLNGYVWQTGNAVTFDLNQ